MFRQNLVRGEILAVKGRALRQQNTRRGDRRLTAPAWNLTNPKSAIFLDRTVTLGRWKRTLCVRRMF
jgi:hypothetical protein